MSPPGEHPPRVLHVLDRAAGDHAALLCATCVSTLDPATSSVVVLDSLAQQRRFTALGLEVNATLTPGGFHTLSARRCLRTRLRTHEADVVQAWSVSAARAARAISGAGPPVVLMAPLPGPVPGEADPSRGAKPFLADVTVAALPWQARAAWDRHGAVDIRQLPGADLAPAHLADVDRLRHDPALRDQRRAALGIEPEDKLVLLLADPPAHADIRRFVFVLGMLHVAGARVVGVAPSGGARLEPGARHLRQHGRRWGLVLVQEPVLPLLACADLAITDAAGGDGGLVLAQAARQLGTPLVHVGPGPIARAIARGAGHAALQVLTRVTPSTPPAPVHGPVDLTWVRVLNDIWHDAAASRPTMTAR